MAQIMRKVQFGREIRNHFSDVRAFTLPFPSLNVSLLKSLSDRSAFSAEFRGDFAILADDIVRFSL